MGTLPKTNKAEFDMNAFWAHSLAVASAAQKIGEMRLTPDAEPEDLFSVGLMHDIGKVVFALYMPKEFRQALAMVQDGLMSLHDAELEIFGANHADIGALLAEKWDLPETLVQGIALHHSPFTEDPVPLGDCVFAANQLCKMLAFGFAGEYEVEQLPKAMQERLTMDLEGIMSALPDMEEELSKANVFIHA
ncbi:MAG: HDOD domain-containing protein [Desulfovibrio sp.]|nr:MAG: HDOD domain-containing protein [Desulfovibrio sp.]